MGYSPEAEFYSGLVVSKEIEIVKLKRELKNTLELKDAEIGALRSEIKMLNFHLDENEEELKELREYYYKTNNITHP